MTVAQPMPAAERLFRDDLAGGAFAAGVDRGRWRLVEITWPNATIEIAAAPRAAMPDWYALRFDLSGYPEAPTAMPWDVATRAPLAAERWPSGADHVSRAFNPGWRADALYLPVDRIAQDGHDAWKQASPAAWWDPAGDITQYLWTVYELLNSEGYTGVRG